MAEMRIIRPVDEDLPRHAAQQHARRLAHAGLDEVDVGNAIPFPDGLDIRQPLPGHLRRRCQYSGGPAAPFFGDGAEMGGDLVDEQIRHILLHPLRVELGSMELSGSDQVVPQYSPAHQARDGRIQTSARNQIILARSKRSRAVTGIGQHREIVV
ncbi:hypothetical protein D3C71_1464270 [compost metagenome]